MEVNFVKDIDQHPGTQGILPTVNTLIWRRGHYNAWKLSTSSFLVRIEMLRLMTKMSAKILKKIDRMI